MTFVDAILFFSISVIIGVFARVLGEDAKTFVPRLCKWMVIRASKVLVDKQAERYKEEWLYDIEQWEEVSGKLARSCGIYFWGRWRVGSVVGFNNVNLPYNAYFKRAIDFFFASISFIVLLPITLFFALIIKIESPGPVFFSQEVIGRNGKQFRIYMFRYMQLLPAENGKAILTGIGKVLYRGGYHQLPLLLNVMRGQMSLIGPRPRLTSEGSDRKPSVRPGITGPWISGLGRRALPNRQTSWYHISELHELESVMDAEYESRVGPYEDLKILLRTILNELRGV